jgi:hypothetical protein
MGWFSIGSDKKRIKELETRVQVLEHNLTVMIEIVKNTAGAVEKIGGFMQEIDREITMRQEKETRVVILPKEKKEYIN